MKLIEVLMIGIGLSMDAFAVSVCQGLLMKCLRLKTMIKIAFYFGFFQAFMPLLGYGLGKLFYDLLSQIDHWIVFILLGWIGGNMIREALQKEDRLMSSKTDFKTMLPLAIATSIDALALGMTFAFLQTSIIFSAMLIGGITFIISFLGVLLGSQFGSHLGKKAEVVGGIILIFMGVKILIEHLKC